MPRLSLLLSALLLACPALAAATPAERPEVTAAATRLKAKVVDGGVTLTDAKGNVAKVTTADLKASNGVVHVVDKVLMP